jgi:hypothetical protein
MRPLVLVALLAGSSVGFAQDFGPIETRIHRSISLPFLRLDPRRDVLGEGERRLSVGLTSANDIRRLQSGGRIVAEDYEVERLLVRYRQGLRGAMDLTVDLPLMSRGGGFQDPLIDGWHKSVLGIRGNIREGTPYGRSEVIVPGSARFGSAAGIGDVSAVLSKGIDERLMAEVGVKLPTGDASRLLGSGAVDAAADLQWRVPVSRWFGLRLQGGLVFQGKAPRLARSRSVVDQEAVVLEYGPNSRDHWVLQWQSEASALETGVAQSDEAHRVLTLGYQRKLSDRQTLEAFFTEDGDWLNFRVPQLVNVGVDWTIGLRFVTRF